MASRIEDYAIIGDGRTAALISREGSLDWLCLPRFDGDACCAALLGTSEHGYWRIAPTTVKATGRAYRDDTMVLDTSFTGDSARVRLTDFMPISTEHPTVVRELKCLAGSARIRCELALRFDYGLVAPRIRRHDGELRAIAGPDMVVLRAPVDLQCRENVVIAEFDISAGETRTFVLSYGYSHEPAPAAIDPADALEHTLKFWRDWASHFRFETPWRDAVMRSLLTLKTLSYHPTGSLVAAPTTSLPEEPGGSLNWDYRFCWLRDASFTLAALLNAGYHEEAVAWRDWMLRAIAAAPDRMRIMYRVDGGRRLHEWMADWLPGYDGAVPVRIGNDAAAQEQIDVVGELLDALDLIARAGIDETAESRAAELDLVLHLEKTWQDKGHGLWESRGRPQRYTYSCVMAWVGVDRFLRSAPTRNLDGGLVERLDALRARIRAEIMERAWNFSRGHFVDRFGGENVDASLLLLPLVKFLPANDPRMAATIDAVQRELGEDGLIWRTPRGGPSNQGAFIACTCWLADCRGMQGRREEAVSLLERVLALRNDVGLLSEEYHPGLRRLIGNFPQALSHLALVNTALGLSGPVLQRGGG